MKYSPGGEYFGHVDQAVDFVKRGVRLVIDGPCESSCTISADINRLNTCITEKAVFHFHKAATDIDGGRIRIETDMPYRPRLKAWIEKRGGLPFQRQRMLTMDNREARKFWPLCEGAK